MLRRGTSESSPVNLSRSAPSAASSQTTSLCEVVELSRVRCRAKRPRKSGGSAPVPSRRAHRGPVAQLVEHLVYTQGVGGSRPSRCTTFDRRRGGNGRRGWTSPTARAMGGTG